MPKLVSIPERVWGGLELVQPQHPHPRGIVSIPERVWGGLEPHRPTSEARDSAFQSLRGFGVGWSF